MQDRIALRARPTDQWISQLRERYPAEASIDEALTRKLKKRGQPAYHSPSFEEIGERLHRLISAGTAGDIAIRNLRSLTGAASK